MSVLRMDRGAMTNVDKALLLAEWTPACPVCEQFPNNSSESPMLLPTAVCGHKVGCAMDLALAERGYASQDERDAARAWIASHNETQLPPSAPAVPSGLRTSFQHLRLICRECFEKEFPEGCEETCVGFFGPQVCETCGATVAARDIRQPIIRASHGETEPPPEG